MAAARSAAKPVIRILLAYPAELENSVDSLIAVYNPRTVEFELLGILNEADLISKMVVVRRKLADVSGFVFFNRDFEATRTHMQWFQQIRAVDENLPSVFVHFPGLQTNKADAELKKQLLYRFPKLSLGRRWPRLTLLLQNALVMILIKVNRFTEQRARAALRRPPRQKVSREVPR